MGHFFFFIYIITLITKTSGYVNLALRKPANMSTILNDWGPQLSNDGDKRNSPAMEHNSCSHTLRKRNFKCWWQVNLENVYFIKEVVIVYRQTFEFRLAGFSIFISNSSDFKTGKECYHYTSTDLPPASNTWPCTGYGQYVTIYNERNSSIPYPSSFDRNAVLELCEVQIFGCPYYKYGRGCVQDCFCDNITCDPTTGICPGNCRSGYTGPNCNQCEPGRFGKTCEQCGKCKLNLTCDSLNGRCPAGCKVGWQLPTCLKECINGTYGVSCSEQCGHCSGGDSCHPVTGVCSNRCEPGYAGPICKDACEPGTYGEECSRQCGFCKEYTTCDLVTGLCSYGCRSGWQKPDCVKACSNQTYGENCQYECGHCKNRSCDRFSGVCADGCDLGFIGDRCDKVCEVGLHGSGCKNNCGNCYRNEGCHHKNGTCPNGCIPGWDPPLCVTCIPDYYGPECKHKCGKCLGQEPCDQATGECPNGCEENWNGTKCEYKTIYKDTRLIYIKVFNYPVVIICVVITVCCLFGVVWCVYIVLKQKRKQMGSCIAVAYKDINSGSTYDLNNETSDSVDLIREEKLT